MSNSSFRPGYAKAPLVFGGHEKSLEEFANVFENYDFGENQSVLISGLRGSGKTAMLSQLDNMAKRHGWLVIRDDASKGLTGRLPLLNSTRW